MKYVITIILLLSVNLYSQDSTRHRPDIKGSINGTVLDDKNVPVAGASVSLLRVRDSSVVTGAESDSQGKFSFKDIPAGRYNLRVGYVGYSTVVVKNVAITPDKQNVTIDTVKLRSGETTTEEIVVEAQKSAVEFTPEKKVFNVRQGMSVEGGNALDVLKNLPSVTVDNDGNVSLRGTQNVKIMVDGKPFGLEGQNRSVILEQLPANQIESIELMTNPTAKYEAEGNSGIINIVMKKDQGPGYNGTVSLNVGTKDKYNGSVNLNMKNDKWNIFTNYNYRQMNFGMNGDNSRQYFGSSSLSSSSQTSSGSNRMFNNMVKGGLEYSINNLQSLSLSGTYSKRHRMSSDRDENFQYDLSNNLSSHYLNTGNEDGKGYEANLSLNYTGKFGSKPDGEKNNGKNKGKRNFESGNKGQSTITADFNYSRSKNDGTKSSIINYITPNQNPYNTNQYSTNITDNFSGQSDFVLPFDKDTKLEAGLKMTYRKNDRDIRTDVYDFNSNAFVTDPNLTNRFIYKEYISSGYTTYTGKLNNLGYMLGLRAEQTYSKGELINTGEIFKQNYFSIFPSASLSYNIGKENMMQLSYSRRINRPGIRELNPFRNSTDPYNISTGNPQLKPEYIDSYELSYLAFLKGITITPSLFYRYTHDQITRLRSIVDSNVTMTTFANYSTNKAYGTELLINANLFKVLNLNGSVSYFRTDVDASNIQPGLTNSTYSWNARLASGIRIPDIADLQLNYFYSDKTVTPQGEVQPVQSLDATLKKDFLDKKLSVGLRVSDIFNTMQFKNIINDPSFSETSTRKRDSRNVFLTLSYKFGTDTKAPEKRRPKKEDQEPPADEEP